MSCFDSAYMFVCFFFFLLVRVLFIGADMMKLNKSRLKQLAQSGEVAAAPVSLKSKKVDEGSSKRAEEGTFSSFHPSCCPFRREGSDRRHGGHRSCSPV